jgi:hypothetical protein
VLAFFSVAALGVTFYKWVDEEGVTHYSETPPPGRKVQLMETPTSPAGVTTKNYFEPVRHNFELLGCWKRINFSESSMKKMNESEPYPLEHQWYCFSENGKYWELHSSKDDRSSVEEKLKILKTLIAGQDYSIPREGLILIHNNKTDENIYWVTSTVSKDVIL